MKLMDKAPTWSIRDEHGLITVTLQWEHPGESKYLGEFDECSWKFMPTGSQAPTASASAAAAQYDKVYSSTFPRGSSGRSNLRGASSRNIRTAAAAYNAYRRGEPLPSKALSAEDFSLIDRGEDLSSAADLTSYCDFHCSSLHREGGSITVSNRSVGTSPILDRTISPLVIATFSRTTSPFETAAHPPLHATDSIGSAGSQHTIITTPTGTTLKAKKGPVRFMDVEKEVAATTASVSSTTAKPSISLASFINGQHVEGSSSDDSETETTEREEEQLNEKALLLIDQLSIDQKRHLSIKDIGIILERLNSKIVDIDKLERDKESAECYNWLIKGTIKGDVLREIGVVYNGHYYNIMEHPGYY